MHWWIQTPFSVQFVTGRNEVVAKVMFLHVSVILLTGGEGVSGEPPQDQGEPPWTRQTTTTPLGPRRPPQTRQTTPPAGTKENHPPGTKENPPGPRRPPQTRQTPPVGTKENPPGTGRPPPRHQADSPPAGKNTAAYGQ